MQVLSLPVLTDDRCQHHHRTSDTDAESSSDPVRMTLAGSTVCRWQPARGAESLGPPVDPQAMPEDEDDRHTQRTHDKNRTQDNSSHATGSHFDLAVGDSRASSNRTKKMLFILLGYKYCSSQQMQITPPVALHISSQG